MKENEEKQDRKVLTLDDISKEDLLGAVAELQGQLEEKDVTNTYVVDPLLLDDEELIKMFGSKEFEEGKKFGYKLAGLYTTLVSSGMSLEEAMAIASNHQTLLFNVKVVETQAKTVKRSSGSVTG